LTENYSIKLQTFQTNHMPLTAVEWLLKYWVSVNLIGSKPSRERATFRRVPPGKCVQVNISRNVHRYGDVLPENISGRTRLAEAPSIASLLRTL
jgi:hypothetical protein